jgi:hypothetical protein
MHERNSSGLEQFVASLRESVSPRILDLSGANQNNLDFLSRYGVPTSDEFANAMTTAFGEGPDLFAHQSDPLRVEQFCRLSLDHEAETFDGILVWDRLEYAGPELLGDIVAHLREIAKPGAMLLCYFHADAAAKEFPVTQFRIRDAKTIQSSERDRMRPTQFHSNRAIEKMFQNFQSVKFFLTRDHIREVIVRR